MRLSAGLDPGVGKRGTCPPEVTASRTLPPVFLELHSYA